jgi:hypothetical protein
VTRYGDIGQAVIHLDIADRVAALLEKEVMVVFLL